MALHTRCIIHDPEAASEAFQFLKFVK